jgi:hypothetical protein
VPSAVNRNRHSQLCLETARGTLCKGEKETLLLKYEIRIIPTMEWLYGMASMIAREVADRV